MAVAGCFDVRKVAENLRSDHAYFRGMIEHCIGIRSAKALFQERRDGRAAEGDGLLNRYRIKSLIGGSNPPPSAILRSSEI